MLVRTEYSFGRVFGRVEQYAARLPAWGGGIADAGTWGWVAFREAMKKVGKPAALGLSAGGRAFLARNPEGLKALISVASGAPPDPSWVGEGLVYAFPEPKNLYPATGDRDAWGIACPLGRREPGTGRDHLWTPEEARVAGVDIGRVRAAIEECAEVPLPKAQNVKFGVEDPLAELRGLCEQELRKRRLGKAYKERLAYELRLIGEKAFADYFLVLSEALIWCKDRGMLIGPARGSSCGSLVCWLTRITEIDPIKHGLLFERFIDVNRFDYPDIDVDFPDTRREEVFEHFRARYGADCVAHLGTIMRMKAKSALSLTAKVLGIPLEAIDAFKDSIVERSSGDSRANDSVGDALNNSDPGKKLLEAYPGIILAARIEGSAAGTGTHAAGLIITNSPVLNFCAVGADGVAQVEKKSAEKLNLLKIDALGLRNLTVLTEACKLSGLDPIALYDLPLEDEATFNTLNHHKYAGIFQFEGISLQNIAHQIHITQFSDIAAITALARPGPLSSGETSRWVARKAGTEPVTHIDDLLAPITSETFGCVVYQEQVMRVMREIGAFSWADTSGVRKIMSDRKGDEAFSKYEKMFMEGAGKKIGEEKAAKIWKGVNSFGSWAFNKSHAVAYGVISYWCAHMKAHHPLEFGAACLRHAKDKDSALIQLRELIEEGLEYVALDPERSEEAWIVKNRRLIGPLTGVKGIGPVMAREIINRKENGIKLTARQSALLKRESVFAEAFPCRTRWKDLYARPTEHGLAGEVMEVREVEAGFARVIGKVVKKNLRDMNEERYVVKRGGRVLPPPHHALLFHIEDDTGRLLCYVGRFQFDPLGKEIVEKVALGDYVVVAGEMNAGFKMLNIQRLRRLGR